MPSSSGTRSYYHFSILFSALPVSLSYQPGRISIAIVDHLSMAGHLFSFDEARWLDRAIEGSRQGPEQGPTGLPGLEPATPMYTPEMLHEAEPAPVLNYTRMHRVFRTRPGVGNDVVVRWKYVKECRTSYKTMVLKLRWAWAAVEDAEAYSGVLAQIYVDTLSDTRLSAADRETRQLEVQLSVHKNLDDLAKRRQELGQLHETFVQVAALFGTVKEIFLETLPNHLLQRYYFDPNDIPRSSAVVSRTPAVVGQSSAAVPLAGSNTACNVTMPTPEQHDVEIPSAPLAVR